MTDSLDPLRRPFGGTGTPGPAAETLDGFSDWHEIGRGGDAIVYRAIQDSLGREVAIKVLTLSDDESVRRFQREIRLMVALGRRHPNIAKVIQIGTSSLGRPCIVMEYYELGSLDRRLSHSGPLSADEVVRVGTVIADALDFAHGDGVLHRDVKPQNILVLPTSYVLADFGIARLIDSAHTSSSDRFSYRHASPQVLDGLPPAETDDVFSLGATMFHLLDGQPPFSTGTAEPDSALAYIRRVRVDEPRRLNRPDVPPGLQALIDRCLRKDPAERPRTAGEVRDLLLALPPLSAQSPRSADAGVDISGNSAGEGLGTAAAHGRPMFVSPAADAGWGVAAGQVVDPDDLTTLRLGSARAGVPADGELARAESTEPGPDGPKRWISRWTMLTAGLLVGVLVVVIGALVVNRTPPEVVANPPTPTPAPAAPTTPGPTLDPHNPDLAPRNLRVTLEGNIATATWQRAIVEPDGFSWGVTASPDDEVRIERRVLPSERTAQTTINPSWDQICFTVIGTLGGQLGAARECVHR
ncbi:MAG: serine/threonine-protein kinase [Propionibacteriaceae bacterium]|nr:serine/threonine-protein kinase [Propionibacteriaceae bacterium]